MASLNMFYLLCFCHNKIFCTNLPKWNLLNVLFLQRQFALCDFLILILKMFILSIKTRPLRKDEGNPMRIYTRYLQRIYLMQITQRSRNILQLYRIFLLSNYSRNVSTDCVLSLTVNQVAAKKKYLWRITTI